MVKFKEGDMVRYVGGHPMHNTTEFIGCVGTIVRAYEGDTTVRIRFIRALSSDRTMAMQGGDNGDWGCCVENLEKIKLVREGDNG